MGVYISNIVGSDVLGGYQIIMSVYGFAINLAISGLGFTATRLVAEKLAQGKIHTSKQASKSIITYSFLFGIIANHITVALLPLYLCVIFVVMMVMYERLVRNVNT